MSGLKFDRRLVWIGFIVVTLSIVIVLNASLWADYRRYRKAESKAMPSGNFGQTEPVNNRANPEDEEHFEASDVDARALFKVGALFVVALFAVVAAAWGLQVILTGQLPNLQPPSGGLAAIPNVTPAPEPRLQAEPVQDLQTWRAAEDHLLHSYGWIDQNAGVVRIPIERAMDLLATRGLPARAITETQSSSDQGQTLPSSSSSGRMLEQITP